MKFMDLNGQTRIVILVIFLAVLTISEYNMD